MKAFFVLFSLVSIVLCGVSPVRADEGILVVDGKEYNCRDDEFPPYQCFQPDEQAKLFARLAEVRAEKQNNPGLERTPIFVITCDRISVLVKSLLSYYSRIDTPIEVVIQDNHSTYPPTIEFLERLEQEGIVVYRSGQDVVYDRMLNNLTHTINHWYTTHDSRYYVVTDPDVELEEGANDILKVFAALLDEHTSINVVGPMLRRDDLPEHYPLRDRVQTQQAEVYHGHPSWTQEIFGKEMVIQLGFIDTCFGLYRKDFQFHNYNQSLQTYDPYQARHLDWYLDPKNLAADQLYYLRKNSPVGHWGSTWLNGAL